MLDYDGTLAPFRERPEEAVPAAGALEAIRELAASPLTTIAVVSGRPVEGLSSVLPPLRVAMVGVHGWEMRRLDGSLVRHPLGEAAASALDRIVGAARAAGWGARLEVKRGALVMHTRGLPPDEARRLELGFAGLAREEAGDLEIRPIHGGVEVRATGRNKGTAVRDLLSGEPPGTFPVYVGDDDTDEDAFRAVRGIGLGIRVGDATRPTLAQARLPGCDDVVAFLRAWLDHVERSAPKGRRG
jgi:trehalose-phosphatase